MALSPAAGATRGGVAVDDSIIHEQVQRAGERAEQQAQARITASAAPQTPMSPGALVIMLAGSQFMIPLVGGLGRSERRVAASRHVTGLLLPGQRTSIAPGSERLGIDAQEPAAVCQR